MDEAAGGFETRAPGSGARDGFCGAWDAGAWAALARGGAGTVVGGCTAFGRGGTGAVVAGRTAFGRGGEGAVVAAGCAWTRGIGGTDAARSVAD